MFRCVERFRSACPFELRHLRPTQKSSGCVIAVGVGWLAAVAWLIFVMARHLHAGQWPSIAVGGLFTAFFLLLGLLFLFGVLYGHLGRLRLAVDAKAGMAFREGRLFGVAVERTLLVAQPPVAIPEWHGGLPASLSWLPSDDPAVLSRTIEEIVRTARLKDKAGISRLEAEGRELFSDAPPLVASVLLSLAAAGRIRLRRVERETAWIMRRKSVRGTTIHVEDGVRAGNIDGLLEGKLLSALSKIRTAKDEPFGPSARQLVEALFPATVVNPEREPILDVRREARACGLVREVKGQDVPHLPAVERGIMVRVAAWIEDQVSFWVEEPGAASELGSGRERLVALRKAVKEAVPALAHDLEKEIRAAFAARES